MLDETEPNVNYVLEKKNVPCEQRRFLERRRRDRGSVSREGESSESGHGRGGWWV